jgi:hypothetical protein
MQFYSTKVILNPQNACRWKLMKFWKRCRSWWKTEWIGVDWQIVFITKNSGNTTMVRVFHHFNRKFCIPSFSVVLAINLSMPNRVYPNDCIRSLNMAVPLWFYRPITNDNPGPIWRLSKSLWLPLKTISFIM